MFSLFTNTLTHLTHQARSNTIMHVVTIVCTVEIKPLTIWLFRFNNCAWRTFLELQSPANLQSRDLRQCIKYLHLDKTILLNALTIGFEVSFVPPDIIDNATNFLLNGFNFLFLLRWPSFLLPSRLSLTFSFVTFTFDIIGSLWCFCCNVWRRRRNITDD